MARLGSRIDAALGGEAERLFDAFAEHPGRTAGLSFLTTPLALKAGRIALRWARRNPALALTVGVGAVLWMAAKKRAEEREILEGEATDVSRRTIHEGGAVDAAGGATDSLEIPGGTRAASDPHGRRASR